MSDGLYDPLGTAPRPIRRYGPTPWVIGGVLVAALAIIGVAILHGGDDRGEPRAVVTIERLPPVTTPPPASAPEPAASPPAAAAFAPPGAEVEIQNGVRIVRLRPASPPAPDRLGGVPSAPVPGSAGAPAVRRP